MVTLTGLPGISEREKKALTIVKSNEIFIALREGFAVTSAGNNGALNIWIDDDFNYRCESMRYGTSWDNKTFDSAEKAERWAYKWLKIIH